MDMTTGVRLLRVLNSRPEGALTTAEIARRWRDLGGTEVTDRSIQRYMKALSDEDNPEGPPLVDVLVAGRERRYYLRTSQVANWFMTEESALDLQLTRQVLGRAFGALGRVNRDKLVDMAERVANASPETKRIRDRLRIAPDGIGRLPAHIQADVLKAAINAIGKGKKLKFDYTDPAGKTSSQLVSPLGLVAKDGTIYLVAVKGLSDTPRHPALHRMSHAELHFQASQSRPEFDLDRYIQETHQFSHPLGGDSTPTALKLRVAPESIYHFRERPLSTEQSISPPRSRDGWHLVTAQVPNTYLLVPFLLSMGPWIEVLEPADVRTELVNRLRAAAARYTARKTG